MVDKLKSKWNKEKVELLQKLYLSKKYSAKEIGLQLGFTKNAVVGKIHRLGLNKEEYSDLIGKDSDVEAEKEKHQYGTYLLSEIDDTMCVWPVGDDCIRFCGRKVLPRTGKFYCEEHFKTAYLRFSQKAEKKASSSEQQS